MPHPDFSKISELLERSRSLRKAAETLICEADELERKAAEMQHPIKEDAMAERHLGAA